jgi:NADH-quinone oxidoreductase subunit M
VALRQQDWHQLIAYSTVSHAGYLLLGIAALNVVGVTGVVLMMFAHGILIALIFALLGAFGAQGRRISDFGGIARVAPFVGVCMAMAAMAAAGMAGFANFASEVMVFIGSWQAASTALRFGTVAPCGPVFTVNPPVRWSWTPRCWPEPPTWCCWRCC